MNWLVVSIVASVVLTIVLNIVLRALAGSGNRGTGGIENRSTPIDAERAADRREHRFTVVFPWKAALLASLVLTILFNLALGLM
ncbi:MAG TPA: hypothetical protein VK860_03110 [Ilumatobacteraceae bacterium]|nr:hypothetical protein [Ilumatobacteraceae bacterium]